MQNLLHPPIDGSDEDTGLAIEEYEVQCYIKGLRHIVEDYIDMNPIPHDYTLSYTFTPVYYTDNDFE